jgi:hypothetical protein
LHDHFARSAHVPGSDEELGFVRPNGGVVGEGELNGLHALIVSTLAKERDRAIAYSVMESFLEPLVANAERPLVFGKTLSTR